LSVDGEDESFGVVFGDFDFGCLGLLAIFVELEFGFEELFGGAGDACEDFPLVCAAAAGAQFGDTEVGGDAADAIDADFERQFEVDFFLEVSVGEYGDIFDGEGGGIGGGDAEDIIESSREVGGLDLFEGFEEESAIVGEFGEASAGGGEGEECNFLIAAEVFDLAADSFAYQFKSTFSGGFIDGAHAGGDIDE
jgi:hypothetical protein